MPVHVLLDATPLARGHATRGIGLATTHLIEALRTELPYDARPTLLTTADQAVPDGYTSQRFRWPRWPTHHVPDPWPALRLHDRLRAIDPKLVHATQPELTPDPWQYPTVATCYDLTPLHENIRNPLQRTAYSTYLQRLGRAQLISAISQATADDLTAQLGIPPARIRVIPLGLPPASPPAGDTPPGPYLLYANSIEPHKNPARALDVLNHHPTLRLVMTGTWSRRRLARLTEQATRDSVADRVTWMGYVQPAHLAALRRDAAAVIVPSRREGFGLGILEALAAGTPVLASDIPVFREVGGSVPVYLDPDDGAAWADAADAVTRRDPALAEAGQVWAAGFTWQRTAELTVAAWREVLANG